MDSWERNLRLTLCSQCGWNQVGRSALPNWLLTRLDQRFPKLVGWASSSSSTEGLVRHADSQVHPTESDVLGVRAGICVSTSPPGDADALSNLKTTGLDHFIITSFLSFCGESPVAEKTYGREQAKQ